MVVTTSNKFLDVADSPRTFYRQNGIRDKSRTREFTATDILAAGLVRFAEKSRFSGPAKIPAAPLLL
jgi:hypothetical protein